MEILDFLKDKSNCCGCSSCVQACPKKCLEMQEDEEGFLYPHKNVQKCIDCGLCKKVCPIKQKFGKCEAKEIFAVKNEIDEERSNSSSGGFFICLAKFVLSQKGVVFGAVFDTDFEVHHVAAKSMEEISGMQGSKYVQSSIENTYNDALAYLKEGRLVLFTGTPCQIKGLHAFLKNKQYPNLLTMAFLCHGVPSPGVWRRYLSESFDELNKRLLTDDSSKNVVGYSVNTAFHAYDINFRDKQISGWKKYHFVIRRKSSSRATKNTIVLSSIYYDNPFMKGFLSNIYLRPSCYECKCKNGESQSDITIGDYWGVKEVDRELDDDKGLSIVMINTDKGKQFFRSLSNIFYQKISLEHAMMLNGGFSEHTQCHSKRDKFYRMLKTGKTIEFSVDACMKRSIIDKIIDRCLKLTQKHLDKK